MRESVFYDIIFCLFSLVLIALGGVNLEQQKEIQAKQSEQYAFAKKVDGLFTKVSDYSVSLQSASDHLVGKFKTVQKIYEQCPKLKRLQRRQNNKHRDFISAIEEAGSVYNVDRELIYAVVIVESRCNASAKSHAGAMGLMQLMPTTAKWLGVKKPYDVRDNVLGGGKYLAYLINKFDGKLDLALAAYNSGPVAVLRYKKVPPYRETKNYVKKVLNIYSELRNISKQDSFSA